MKKSKLEESLKEIDNFPIGETRNTERVTNQLYSLNKLHMGLINDFNESTERFNRRIFWLTITMTALTGVIAWLTWKLV